MRKYRFRPHSLPVRMVLYFVTLVALTAAAIGLPALWLLQNQFNRQAWALVTQGEDTTRALYAARQSDLANLAILTAQRPTLHTLIQENETAGLETYLATLLEGARLDFIVVCDAQGIRLAQVGAVPAGDLCQSAPASGYATESAPSGPALWLVATQPLISAGNLLQGSVVTGQALDQAFVQELARQSGLEQMILLDNQPVADSFNDNALAWQAYQAGPLAGPPSPTIQRQFKMGGVPFFASQSPFSAPDGHTLESVVALPVSDLVDAQLRLMALMGGSIFLIALLGSGLGILLARRISQPLAELRRSAAAFRKGDLTTPVRVHTSLPEATTVAYTLEDARLALRHTLNELRQEKEWINHLLEAIVEGIITLDQHGRITYFSPGAERITGKASSQVLGHLCDEIFLPSEGNASFHEFIPAPGTQQKVTVAWPDGRLATLAITGARLAPPEAGRARVALVLRDVSGEETLHRLMGDFLANIAHEFRTPLSAQAASTELLLDQLPDLTQAELQELLTSLHLGVLGLQTLIDNLLEGASLEAGRFRVYPRPSNLNEIVHEAGQTMQPLLQKYGAHLRLELPDDLPLVQADPRRTAQVLVNLLSNGVKFGPQGGEIYLRVTCQEGEVQVAVADQGPGISPEHQPDLFRRFVHLGTGSQKAQAGLGLGLSVVKAIVEAQGGQVQAANRPEGGTVFWFTLPLAVGVKSEA